MRWQQCGGARTGRRGDAPQVIVVGAGFAGMAAVEELDRAGAQVLLIDRNVYSTFQPLLYQVATGGLNPGDVSYPARAFTRGRGARFRLGDVTGVDPVRRQVTLADGGRFDYDYLILATGVSAAYYGVAGRPSTASACTPAATRWSCATTSWPGWNGWTSRVPARA